MKDSFEILISSKQINDKISELAFDISSFYTTQDSDKPLFIWLMEGARYFIKSLSDKIKIDVDIYALKVSSYRNMEKSSGKLDIFGEIPNVKNRRVLLIDDILDTALTAKTLIEKLNSLGAREVRTCFLLNKIEKNKGIVKPDFQGFEIPDVYVVGFGLDSAGLYRDLPDICVRS